MFQTVHDYVGKCEICQKTKASTLKPAGLLQPLPIPCQVWDDITLDFIEGLPNSHGKNSILVVVDRLSKSAHFMALTHPFTAKTVAEKFIDGVVKLHGMPKSIISDRDPIFISKFWQEFFHMSGTQLNMSSAYHPQTDGQTEVINRCLEQYLRSFVHQWQKQWNSYLPWAEYWYNTTYHESTSMTPFLALYGRHPLVVPMYHVESSPVHKVDQALLSRDELLRQLKQNLKMATNRMKQFADTKTRDVEFKEGDMVFLRLPPYRQTTVFRRAHQKLTSKYSGPYPILRRVGQVAYELKLPTGSRVHPVFHVSLLKKYVGEMPQFSADLPYVNDDGVLVLEPDKIIDVRWLKRGGKLVEQSLVRWKRLPHEDATWEDSEFLAKQFPHLTLEDKGPLRGGGIDTPRRSSRIPKPSNKYAGYI
ncbi:Integrase catalytic domain-containing protein [Citrus sinensis]|uniref:Integrase catalytic domain-containing protein n=1 Tax=Citrus sinensis TaxID=2711 RepID=A0ACB8KH19_CITSI|nr:Integrase catalytic domain-containing protein [Citrus sinensis]